jgi:hypothetical protein
MGRLFQSSAQDYSPARGVTVQLDRPELKLRASNGAG